mgnify:CR=1 FL=1
MKDLKDNAADVFDTEDQPINEGLTGRHLEAFFEKNKHLLIEKYDLSELYEEEAEEEESVEEHFVGGVVTKLGTKSDGSPENSRERKKRIRNADIYRKHLQEIQSWKHMTSGRRK